MSHWIVVADGSRARVFSSDVMLKELEEVGDLTHPETRLPGRELVSDSDGRRGVSAQTGAETRHGMERKVFARQVAQHLLEGLEGGKYTDLVLAAPPAFLGDLRAQLDKRVADTIRLSLDKDYTRLPRNELSNQLLRHV